jgi:uncharacterized membrane protein YoaK (UPF0700 family)
MSARNGSKVPARATAIEAFLLAGVGGSVDAIGVLTLGGLFVAHMSGNSAALGAAFGHGDWRTGLPHLFAVPVFLLGLFIGYVWILPHPTSRRCGTILLVEAALLSVFAVQLGVGGFPERNTLSYFAFAAPPLLAMGLQNATLREIGRSAFPSTYVTGVLDSMAKSAVVVFAGKDEGGTAGSTARRAAGLWLCYLLGALSGSAGLLVLRSRVLVVAVTVLVIMAARFLFTSRSIASNKPRMDANRRE